MKKLFIPVVTMLLISTGCSSKDNNYLSQKAYHDYDEILDKTISWSELLEQTNDEYFSYVYSPKCGHCNDIKQDVLDYGLSHNNFYFILYSSEIPVSYHVEHTIGKSDINDIFIVGTPTLIKVRDHTVINNIAGSKGILETLTNQ